MTASAEIPAVLETPASSFRHHVAAEVRAHLARRQLSHRSFARQLGVTAPWIDRRLNGVTPLTTDDIELFADALGLTIAELLGIAPRPDKYRCTYGDTAEKPQLRLLPGGAHAATAVNDLAAA